MAQSEIHVSDGKSNGFIENDNNISDIKREDKDIAVDYEYRATRSYASSYSPTSDNLRRRPLQTYEQREKESCSPKVETSKSKSSNKLSGKDKCRVVFFILFILLNAAGIYLICVESDSAVKILTGLKRDVMNNFFTGNDQGDVASTDTQVSDESVKIVKGFSPPEVKTEPDVSSAEKVDSVAEEEANKSELPAATQDEVKSSEHVIASEETEKPASDKISADNDETTTERKDTLEVAHETVAETENVKESDEKEGDTTYDANIANDEAETKGTPPSTLQEENADKLTNVVTEETGNEPSKEDVETKDISGEIVQEGGNEEASSDANPVEQQDITAQIDEKGAEGTQSDEAQSEPVEEEPITRMKRNLSPPPVETEDNLPLENGADETSAEVVQSEGKDTSEPVQVETTEQTSDTKEVVQSEPVEEKMEEKSLEGSEDDIKSNPSESSEEAKDDSEQPLQNQQPTSPQETSPEEVQSTPTEVKHDAGEAVPSQDEVKDIPGESLKEETTDAPVAPESSQDEVKDIPGESLKEETSDVPVAPVSSQDEVKDIPGESLKEETTDAPVAPESSQDEVKDNPGESPDQTNEEPVDTTQDELKDEVGQQESPAPKEENADDGPTVVEQNEPSVQPKTEDELTKAGSNDGNPSQVDGPTTNAEQEL